ncbi:MAG: 3-deoxy-8-phosphooctulonate synthase [Nitrospinae bacterium]|nr:3-deoxy-8-phosphooctulonate synthase [Nitrospinota bacterium]
MNTDSLFLIAGPCVVESESHTLFMAEEIKKITEKIGIPYIFKASYDKANRSSIDSYRGPGLSEGLNILKKVKEQLSLEVLSDIHSKEEIEAAANVLDIIQIPAFLCRQTDILVEAGKTGKVVNIKKGQFMAPADMKNAVNKVKSSGCHEVWLTERGTTFGYNNLVVDYRSIPIMKGLQCPVIFDATHSVQLPGGLGNKSGGDRQYIEPLAKAAVAAGAHGLFMEVHDNPEKALCDGSNSLNLSELEELLKKLLSLYKNL